MAVVEIAKTQWGQSTFLSIKVLWPQNFLWSDHAVEMYSDPNVLFEVAEALGEESV